MSVFVGNVVALQHIHCNYSTHVALPQIGVAVHHYLLIGGGAWEGSVPWDGRWVGPCLITYTPNTRAIAPFTPSYWHLRVMLPVLHT